MRSSKQKVCLFLTGILLIVSYELWKTHRKYVPNKNLTRCLKELPSSANDTKYILIWTPKLYSSEVSLREKNDAYNSKQCLQSNCIVTLNRSKLCESSAVVFHLPNLNLNDMPLQRSIHQRYILWTMEPPFGHPKTIATMNSYFNWTMTYRTDSDFTQKYISWRKRPFPLINDTKKDYLENRPHRILWMVSSCYSHSRREQFMRRLSKVIPVTILGRCRRSFYFIPLSSASCRHLPLHECIKAYGSNHTYYFAFENSFCLDYITEKYQMEIELKLMIPLVFETPNRNYERLAIPNSYIDASLFPSPEQFGFYLNTLSKTKYNSYFRWISHYEILPNDNHRDSKCEICRRLHNKDEPNKVYSNLKKWFYEDVNCYRWSSKYNKSIKAPSLDETFYLYVLPLT